MSKKFSITSLLMVVLLVFSFATEVFAESSYVSMGPGEYEKRTRSIPHSSGDVVVDLYNDGVSVDGTDRSILWIVTRNGKQYDKGYVTHVPRHVEYKNAPSGNYRVYIYCQDTDYKPRNDCRIGSAKLYTNY